MLELVADDQSDFGFAGVGQLGEARHRRYLIAGNRRVLAVRDQGDLAVGVDKTDSRQALVLNPATEAQRMEVPHVDAVLGEVPMEAHHGRFVLRADGTDAEGGAVLRLEGESVLDGIRANGERRQCVVRSGPRMKDHASVQSDDALGRHQKRVNVNLVDSRLLDDHLAEAHQRLFQRLKVDGLPAPDALHRPVDVGLLHHAPRQRGVERRQRQ